MIVNKNHVFRNFVLIMKCFVWYLGFTAVFSDLSYRCLASSPPQSYALSKTSHGLSLEAMERARAAGENAWNSMMTNHQGNQMSSSCWDVALHRFRALSAECGAADESTKTILALTLTECHLKPRSGGFPSHTCYLDSMIESLKVPDPAPVPTVVEAPNVKTPVQAWLESRSQLCLSALSESAFSVYIQFFNHIDNICFYLHSTAWQQRTENTINRLTATSEEVVSQLGDAQRQNEQLLLQQKEALQYQHHLALGSERIREALDTGHDSLQSAFSTMRDQVHQEQKRLLSGFHDILALVARVVHVQQAIAGKLADVETILLYVALIIVTFYITATDSTRLARGPLYIFWTVMLLVEIVIWRLPRLTGIELFDDLVLLRRITRTWRLVCVSAGMLYWFVAWWRYRDSTTIIVDVLQAGIKELKEHIQASVTPLVLPDVKAASGQLVLPEEYCSDQESSVSSLENGSPTTEDDTDSVVSETLSLTLGDAPLSPETVPVDYALTPRRNPPRASRPRAYRPPSTRHDVKVLRLNPCLLFESSTDFTETVVRQRVSVQKNYDAPVDSRTGGNIEQRVPHLLQNEDHLESDTTLATQQDAADTHSQQPNGIRRLYISGRNGRVRCAGRSDDRPPSSVVAHNDARDHPTANGINGQRAVQSQILLDSRCFATGGKTDGPSDDETALGCQVPAPRTLLEGLALAATATHSHVPAHKRPLTSWGHGDCLASPRTPYPVTNVELTCTDDAPDAVNAWWTGVPGPFYRFNEAKSAGDEQLLRSAHVNSTDSRSSESYAMPTTAHHHGQDVERPAVSLELQSQRLAKTANGVRTNRRTVTPRSRQAQRSAEPTVAASAHTGRRRRKPTVEKLNGSDPASHDMLVNGHSDQMRSGIRTRRRQYDPQEGTER